LINSEIKTDAVVM